MVGTKYFKNKTASPVSLSQIAVRIPLPEKSNIPTYISNVGTCIYNPQNKSIYWIIGQIPQDKTPSLTATIPLKKGEKIPSK